MAAVGSRVFTAADQMQFAELTGDYNPMHVDPIFARRVGAGAPVVHGVHNLLWCLNAVVPHLKRPSGIAKLRANFDTFVTTGEPVHAFLVRHDEKGVRAEVRSGGLTVLTLQLDYGDKRVTAPAGSPNNLIDPSMPLDATPEMIEAMQGGVPFATSVNRLAAQFPQAARFLGARQVAALGAFTRLVGMICPGLHSVFNRITLDTATDDGENAIWFKTGDVNRDHRRVQCAVWGGGWSGQLTTMMRRPPSSQVSVGEVAKQVKPKEFSDVTALVVGGTRGLGEVAAKLIAAGGGQPIITFAHGRQDAENIASEIHAWGGRCDVLKLDIQTEIAEQLAGLREPPNCLLYFATPMIGQRRRTVFDQARLDTFIRFYVTGFYECCTSLLALQPGKLAAFYPSSVFVEDRPVGFTEYANAKVAGEQLCRDLSANTPRLRTVVNRLPRLATDQNPDLSEADGSPSVAETLLPLIRELCSAA